MLVLRSAQMHCHLGKFLVVFVLRMIFGLFQQPQAFGSDAVEALNIAEISGLYAGMR